MSNKLRFEIVGYGFERVFGSLDKNKFQYWKKNNIEDLIGKDDLLQKHKEHVLFKDGDWSSLDDLGHYEGAGFNDDSELVVYEDKSNKVFFRTQLGEWNLDDENQVLIDSDEFYLNSMDDCKFVFIGESILKGCFFVGFHEINKFNKHKIGFQTIDVNGDVVVIGLMYDGVEITLNTNDLNVDSIKLKVEEI